MKKYVMADMRINCECSEKTQIKQNRGFQEGRYYMKKKKGGKEVAFRPQTIIEARYDLDRRQNDILDILLGIVGEGEDTEENTRYELKVQKNKQIYKNIKFGKNK